MSIYVMKLNKDRCISCKACEVHCKVKNDLPIGIKYAMQTSCGPELKDGKVVIRTAFRSCYHCENPNCVEACPTGAMTKRESDGLVYVQTDICIGCKECIEACPWHIPVYFEERNVVGKCDYCMDRLDSGLLPACVTSCTTHALRFEKKKSAS